MQTRTKRPTHLCVALLTVALLWCAPDAMATRVARFWLEHTVSGEIFGPVINQPGYRFQIGTDGYVVVDAEPGQIIFSTYPQTQYLGPYDVEQDRIIDLGLRAYTIVRLDSVEVHEAPPNIPVHAAPVPPSPALADGSRPGAEIALTPWFWDPAPRPLTSMGWIEPYRRVSYDWDLGGLQGSRDADIETLRLGGTLLWGGWSATLGLGLRGETGASLVPDGLVLSDLRLESGTSLGLGLGYLHRIRLDDGWNALAGMALEHRDEDYDLTGSVLVAPPPAPDPVAPVDGMPTPIPASTTTPTPDPPLAPTEVYEHVTSAATLREMLLLGSGGIEYLADAWGLRLEFLLTVWEDTKVDAKVTILGNAYALDGARSHPLTVALTGWCYIIERARLEAMLSVGAEMAVRLGASYEW